MFIRDQYLWKKWGERKQNETEEEVRHQSRFNQLLVNMEQSSGESAFHQGYPGREASHWALTLMSLSHWMWVGLRRARSRPHSAAEGLTAGDTLQTWFFTVEQQVISQRVWVAHLHISQNHCSLFHWNAHPTFSLDLSCFPGRPWYFLRKKNLLLIFLGIFVSSDPLWCLA